jgi:hypothetical protein
MATGLTPVIFDIDLTHRKSTDAIIVRIMVYDVAAEVDVLVMCRGYRKITT